MTHIEKIETARKYAYSCFTEEEQAIILNCDVDSCCSAREVSLVNTWFRLYRNKLNELEVR